MAATAHLHHQNPVPLSAPFRSPAQVGPASEPRWPNLAGDQRRVCAQAEAPARVSRPQPTGVYWRRRIAVGILLALVGAGLWTVAGWATNFSAGVAPVGADRTDPLPHELVIVQPGDTLWSIAADLAPSGSDSDLRTLVDRLAELNGGSAIEAGQRLVVSR